MRDVMKNRRQLSLFPELAGSHEHGGELSIGKRKGARPVAIKRPMHLVIRASLAIGPWSLLYPPNAHYLKTLVSELARRWNIRIYEFSNNGNHVHLLLKAKTRIGFQNFLRVFAGKLAQFVTGTQNGRPLAKRFFDCLAWSRIIEWGKAFFAAKNYVIRNRLEAAGKIPYQPRKQKL